MYDNLSRMSLLRLCQSTQDWEGALGCLGHALQGGSTIPREHYDMALTTCIESEAFHAVEPLLAVGASASGSCLTTLVRHLEASGSHEVGIRAVEAAGEKASPEALVCAVQLCEGCGGDWERAMRLVSRTAQHPTVLASLVAVLESRRLKEQKAKVIASMSPETAHAFTDAYVALIATWTFHKPKR